ncbi:MAG: NifB/NifX family molybdenum-iron cluster-binding protein [Campylobacterota bacterium]|nr:NifB/NifX family molybdenum-iron cluster-binding protein [Campylobacterota bacterium]
MLAVPIQKLGDNPVVSNYFSKCKWFAIIDKGSISFEKNRYDNGCKIVDWLYDLGVTKTFLNKIGTDPLKKMLNMDISCFYDETKHNNLIELLKKLEDKKLTKVDESNQRKVVDPIGGCKEIC